MGLFSDVLKIGTSLWKSKKERKAIAKAGQAQQDGMDRALDLVEKQQNRTNANQQPFINTGTGANNMLAAIFGTNQYMPQETPRAVRTPIPAANNMPAIDFSREDFDGGRRSFATRFGRMPNRSVQGQVTSTAPIAAPQSNAPSGLDVFFKSPNYEFNKNEMIDAVNRAASAGGNIGSGGRIKAIMDRAGNLAGNEFNNFIAHIMALRNGGQAAVNSNAAFGAIAANRMGALNTDIGNSQAATTLGRNSSFSKTTDDVSGVVGRWGDKFFGSMGI